jgi:archaemetzincin
VRLCLFSEKLQRADVGPIARALEESFGPFGLVALDCGSLYVPKDAILEGRLSGPELLRHIDSVAGYQPSLWLVEKEIFFPDAGVIFGCAARRAAILSRAGLDSETLVKEAVHEVGHMMGLEHCTEPCVMRISANFEEAREKPRGLCSRCRARLEIIGHMR